MPQNSGRRRNGALRQGVSRRQVLGWGAAGGIAAAGWPLSAHAQSATQPLNRWPRMVHEYFVDQVRRVDEQNRRAYDALKTQADAEAYVASVQQRIQESFGPWPEKTPLNARTTKVVERDAYRIENVIFESRPGFPVTANLYVPTNRPLPLPGVVGSCGHSSNGKAAEAYQAFAQGLARQGYVCLIFDPIGQGERLQYTTDDLKPRRGTGTSEHLYAGNQQFLVDEFFGSWRAWDGIRALDYLLTREEVDPQHIGITGNSGGGTMTTWLCGVEQRWTMAAPSCFVTTFLHNMENELPADTEQCPPRVLALGLDHCDFLAAMAPKPVIILAKEKDYFDARGSEEAYRRLKKLYTLLGRPDNIGLFIGPSYHGYSQENREAMYRWFNRVTGISTLQSEPELTIEKDETLWCTPNGQVNELNPRTVFTFTSGQAAELQSRRKPLGGGALRDAVRSALKLKKLPETIDYRILRPVTGRKHPRQNTLPYAVQTEPGIHALVYRNDEERMYSRPPQSGPRAILYVSHHSADEELRDDPLPRELAAKNADVALFACDVRGIGESRPATCGGTVTFLRPYGNDYFYAAHSIMLDRPYVGQRTYDLLVVLEWLKQHGHTDVHLVAKGWGAIPATFAALFSDTVTQITLKNALTSYADVAGSEEYRWPLSSLVPGVLRHFDLPDCYRELESRGLQQIEPWGAEAESGAAE